ncbi:MAG: DinB family protein [Deltaproteobacteria bacterium]|nr:DinB family protein [Deltaproteobacteria bacterium]
MPVTVVGDEIISGFNRDALARLFNLSEEKQKRLAGLWLFETFDKILAAVVRAARQVPPEQLMWHTPDRNRPLKLFCYHILADPKHVLDAISTQKYDGAFKLTYAEESERYRTMEEIAAFGNEIRARVSDASTKLSPEILGRTINGYAGIITGHELLHQVLSHTAHHLRQLYEMLRMIGIQPIEPLEEEDFQGISMPKDLW